MGKKHHHHHQQQQKQQLPEKKERKKKQVRFGFGSFAPSFLSKRLHDIKAPKKTQKNHTHQNK